MYKYALQISKMTTKRKECKIKVSLLKYLLY